MPITITTTLEQALEFAAKAAYDDKFRKKLEKSPQAVMKQYGVVVPASEIPAVRKLPSKAQCAKLLALMLDYDSFAQGQYDPVALGGCVVSYGFAMPLVSTAEGEVGAAR